MFSVIFSALQWKKLNDEQGSVQFIARWYNLSCKFIEPALSQQRVSFCKPLPAAVLSVYVDSAKGLSVGCHMLCGGLVKHNYI